MTDFDENRDFYLSYQASLDAIRKRHLDGHSPHLVLFRPFGRPPVTSMIIGICGYKGSGKSTLTDLLIAHHGFVRQPFADPLKQMLRRLLLLQGVSFAESEQMLYGDLKETPTPYLAGQTPRLAMQTLGTEWRELIATTLWSKIWSNIVSTTDYMKSLKVRIAVDDLRFLHEVDEIRETADKLGRKSYIIYVDRPGIVVHDSHVSETTFIKIKPDFTISNNELNPGDMLNQFNYIMKEALS